MADSVDVLSTLKIVYSIYAWIVISLIAWFAYNIMRDGSKEGAKPAIFYTYIAILVVIGTGLHFLTYNTVPWVPYDLNRHKIKPDKVFHITYKDHTITIEDEKPMLIHCGDKVVFDAKSEDLTYGFGIFRQNGTMVAQMQVVPGSRNDLLWIFDKNGVYNIKSTEYSGPKGAFMEVKDAIRVIGCMTYDRYSMK